MRDDDTVGFQDGNDRSGKRHLGSVLYRDEWIAAHTGSGNLFSLTIAHTV